MKKFLKIALIVLVVLVALVIIAVVLFLHQIKQATQLDYQTMTTADGAAIKYVEYGSGEPLVLVHGYGGNSTGNLALIDKLKDSYRCISFDQRGFGESPIHGEASIQRSAQDIQELLDHLGIEKVNLFGYSMGGAVVMSYLDQFGTARLDKVIIGDITPKLLNDEEWNLGAYQGWYTQEDYEKDLTLFTTDDYSFFYLRLASQMMFPMSPEEKRDFSLSKDELLEAVAARMGGKKEDVEGLVTLMTGTNIPQVSLEVYRSYWKSLGEMDFRDVLSTVDCPVGLLYADPGSLYCPATFEYMQDQIPNAVMLPMENSIHTSQVENFAQSILDFYGE